MRSTSRCKPSSATLASPRRRSGRFSLAESTETEIGDAETFAVEVAHALDQIGVGRAESIAARCAARIRQGVTEIVRAEVDTARAAVVSAKGRSVHAALGERETCARAFEALVLRHTLPEATQSMRMSLESTGTYAAQTSGFTPYGLSWVVALEIPPSHPLARVLRLDRLVERLEIGAPEEAGWLHKEVKVRPQRFDRLHLAQLTLDPAESRMKLRAAPDGSGVGFDVSFHHETGTVELRRVLEGGPSETPYRVEGDDVAKLQSLRENLIAMTADLYEHKKALVEAKLDDDSLKELESPRALVDRLVGNLASTVQEIARRTLSPGELVLKRLVSDNQREEVFLSKAELQGKMDPLPPALRHAFDPLELWSDAAPKHEPAARSRETSSTAARSASKLTPLPRPASTPRPEREVTAREDRAAMFALDESEPALADVADSAPSENATDAAHAFPAGPLSPASAMRPSRPPRP